MSIGIYIHIPFCVSKCNYCDFNSYVAEEQTYALYIDALCREIEETKIGGEVDTIYFGGGTPTILNPLQLVKILDTVRGRFSLTKDCEITTECNPKTMDYLGFLKLISGGFNRLSIGMQSADDSQLKVLGRIHSFDDCKRCVYDARQAGFDNLSLDLMFGLPNQDENSFVYSIKRATELEPEHISCYSLKIEEGTPFAKMDLEIADEEQSRNMYDKCVDYLGELGYLRYEISNFAKLGFESRHNCKYWLCDDFIGFGAGAYSCNLNKRYSNVKNVTEYIKRVNETQSAVEDTFPLSPEDKMSEFVYLGLRMDRGIDEDEFRKRFFIDIKDVYGGIIEKNLKRGTIIEAGGRFKIPPEFTYVSNGILADFV